MKTICFPATKYLFLLLILFLFSNPTLLYAQGSQGGENSWDYITVKVRKAGTNNIIATHAVVVTTNAEQIGVYIGCVKGRLYSKLSLNPISFRQNIPERTKRSRLMTVKLFRDDAMVDQRQWYYLPEFKIIATRDHAPSAKIFNAVVSGKSLSFKTTSHDVVTVELPPIDPEFHRFVEKCGL